MRIVRLVGIWLVAILLFSVSLITSLLGLWAGIRYLLRH